MNDQELDLDDLDNLLEDFDGITRRRRYRPRKQR